MLEGGSKEQIEKEAEADWHDLWVLDGKHSKGVDLSEV